jgi:hypothetical protein
MHDGVLTLENNASGLSWMNEKSVSGERRWGHPAKNDCSTEVLLGFCARVTFLRSVPDISHLVGTSEGTPALMIDTHFRISASSFIQQEVSIISR